MKQKQEKTIGCFDKYSKEYENWFEINDIYYNEELQIIKDIIGDTQNGLEIGMGTGRFAVQPNIVIGIEPSKNMREVALSKGLNVIDGIAEDLPFENETFDFALMMTSICFVQDPQKALKEAFRVIKKNGFLIISFVDKNSELGKQYEANKDKSKFYLHATFYSAAEILALCNSVGFKKTKERKYQNNNISIVFDVFSKN
ncbi:MAG: class I SAM-dependent methyltransferase [Sulfurovaceae bacterium]